MSCPRALSLLFKISLREQPVDIKFRKEVQCITSLPEVYLHKYIEGFIVTNPRIVADILVVNEPGIETIEMTLLGPKLLFTAPAVSPWLEHQFLSGRWCRETDVVKNRNSCWPKAEDGEG